MTLTLLDQIARETEQSVYHAMTWGLGFGDEILSELKAVAAKSDRGAARLCLHPRPDEAHQEMLIVYRRGFEETPQRRNNGFDTKIVIQGSGIMSYYDSRGSRTRQVKLGGDGSFYLNTCTDEFHSIRVDSEFFIFLEIVKGPFSIGTTQFANWSH